MVKTLKMLAAWSPRLQGAAEAVRAYLTLGRGVQQHLDRIMTPRGAGAMKGLTPWGAAKDKPPSDRLARVVALQH